MSRLEIKYQQGATPLDPNELAGLIPNYITTQGELNQLERENILWAGKTRLTDKNIGVPKEQILTKLKILFDDTEFWIQEKTYDFDEIAARFHHRLVSIHAFPNGNGRHARLLTEVIQIVNGETNFTWGSSDLFSSESDSRKDYLAALRSADKGDLTALIKFVRK